MLNWALEKPGNRTVFVAAHYKDKKVSSGKLNNLNGYFRTHSPK